MPETDGLKMHSLVMTLWMTLLTVVELQVLGLLGKLLTVPWMSKFHTSAVTSEIHHIEGIDIVRTVIEKLKEQLAAPLGVLTARHDFFGNPLDCESDVILGKLQQQPPCDVKLFEKMVESCLTSVIKVLERQYARYFSLDITEELRKQTESARSHNIDSEEVMGMFGAAQQKAPNATLHYLSSKIRAQKNHVTDYLDSLEDEKRDNVIKFAISFARKERVKKRRETSEIMVKLAKRGAQRRQKYGRPQED